jgi:aspartyl-tRNA(Asn)/glutamyl-tRNA(Gln) amidotransferase subunit C
MDIKELQITAKLAMLDIPNLDQLGESFVQMVDYFEKMMEVDVDGLEPTTHALAVENRLRSDNVAENFSSEELLELAPDRKDGFFKIPNVL